MIFRWCVVLVCVTLLLPALVSDDVKSLKFDLKIDNDPANQKKIIIGAKMQNPKNNVSDVPVVKVTE